MMPATATATKTSTMMKILPRIVPRTTTATTSSGSRVVVANISKRSMMTFGDTAKLRVRKNKTKQTNNNKKKQITRTHTQLLWTDVKV